MPNQYKYLDTFIDDQRENGQYSFTTEDLHTQLAVHPPPASHTSPTPASPT